MMNSLLVRFPDYPPMKAFVNDSTMGNYMSAQSFEVWAGMQLRTYSERFQKDEEIKVKPLKVGDYINIDPYDLGYSSVNVYRGKYLLVDFWASWCGPCQEEMPNVVSAYKKFHAKGFDIVGISLDENKDEWLDAIESWGMPWIHLSDLNGWKCSAVQKYQVEGIPYNVLIGPDGVVEACDLMGDELTDFLSSVL